MLRARLRWRVSQQGHRPLRDPGRDFDRGSEMIYDVCAREEFILLISTVIQGGMNLLWKGPYDANTDR